MTTLRGELKLFQSTRPRGARPRSRHKDFYPQACFNPRARVGRDPWQVLAATRPSSFNPRARVGRDNGEVARVHDDVVVSIHAPAWGATPAVRQRHRLRVVSIHAPAWGATTHDGSLGMSPVFQSTRPRGARLSPNWTNTNYSTKQSYIQAATKLTKITRPAVPQFCCQGTRANIVINQHHLPFAQHRARQLAKPQGHKVSSHQNAPPFFANSSRGYIRAGYLLTHQ